MMWSKLKQRVEQGFAESLDGRVAINSAAYGACSCGHAWLTLDGKVIANFCTRAYWNRQMHGRPAQINPMYRMQHAAYGMMSRQGAYEACWDFVHALSIEDALCSDDPLIQTLAVLDRRVGKRRLMQIDADKLHTLAQKALAERRIAEGLARHRAAA